MKNTLLILFLFLSVIAKAQTEIRGKVVDPDGQPVSGVSIRILNTSIGSISATDGTFSVIGLAPGEYRLIASAVGYAVLTETIVTSSEPVTITLMPTIAQLDDVVVTAEKTEDDIQRIPVSISALSARQVEAYRLWNIRDITAIAPSLYAANPGDNRNVTSIRGITSTSYDPAVATYIDGVNQFTLDTYIAQLFDVERIEVLRGPQGTLYGRNAMAGVINVITREPDNKTRGFIEANLGNYGQQRYGAGIRTPLIADKLFLGVAGMYDANNGFYTNTFNDSDFDKKRNFTGNYYLKYVTPRRTSFTLNVKHSNNRNDGAFPLAPSPGDAFEKPYEVNQNATTTLVDNVLNTSLNVQHQTPLVNFQSLTTYQYNYRIYEDPIDGDFSPIDGITIFNNYGKDWNNARVFTQELKFTSPARIASRFKWTAGAYLFTHESPTQQATRFGTDAAFIDDEAVPGSFILNTSTAKSNGFALYGQLSYAFTEKLELTAGLRYDYEKREQQVKGEFFIQGIPEPVFVLQSDTVGSASFNALSPKVSLAYHLNDNVTIYGTGARGFRAGGLTQFNPDPSQPALFVYKPEHSFNLEAGLKSMLLADRLQVNAAAYFIRVNDAQVPTLVLPQALTVTRNAGKLDSKGVELELSAKVAKGLHVEYSLGVTDATYQSLAVPQDGAEVNLRGNRQIFTPSHTSMLAIQFTQPVRKSVNLVVRGEWQNVGDQYFDLENNITQKGYSLLNTRAGVVVKDFELMFWGRNLTDKQYIAYAYDFGAAHLGNPANYGVTLRKNF